MEHKPTELGHFCWSLFQFELFWICLKLQCEMQSMHEMCASLS